MGVMVLYEVVGEPASAYPNAFEIPHLDHSKEIYLIDVIASIKRQNLPVGVNHLFYVLVQDELVWLESPSCLVPVYRDGSIRLQLKPTTTPPLINPQLAYQYADRSRRSMYSPEDYNRTSLNAYRTFMVASEEYAKYAVGHPPSPPSSIPSSAATYIHRPFATSRPDSRPTQRPPSQPMPTPAPAPVPRPVEKPFTPSRPDARARYEDSGGQYDDRQAYSDSGSRGGGGGGGGGGGRSGGGGGGGVGFPRGEEGFPRGQGGERDRAEVTFHDIVGNEAATAIAEAAEVAKEAAGMAAKSLFSLASAWGKTITDIAQNAGNASASAAGGGGRSLEVGSSLYVGDATVLVLRELAEGGFGTVYLVERVGSTKASKYALKQLLCQSREQLHEANQELEALRRFRGKSDYIIELLDFTMGENSNRGKAPTPAQPQQVLMLFPVFPLGSLWDVVAAATAQEGGKWPFPEHVALHLVRCAAEALLVFHKAGYAHRDVKPHNFLLERVQGGAGVQPVLMDLGSVAPAKVSVKNKREALQLEEEAASKTSAAYRAPELTDPPFPPFEVDERVDVWGLGCTMYALAFGRSPFESPKEGVLRLAILNGRYTVPAGGRNKDCTFGSGYLKLMASMLAVPPHERPFTDGVIEACAQLQR